MNGQDYITYFGVFVSTVSLCFAIVQTKRLAKSESEQKRKLWSLIATSKALIEDFEHKDMNKALGKVYELYRFLLREAILIENNFNLKTAQKWRKVGKLSSDWQFRQSLMLLDTKEINDKIVDDLSIDFQIWDSMIEDHELNHHGRRLEVLRTKYSKNKDGIAEVVKNEN